MKKFAICGGIVLAVILVVLVIVLIVWWHSPQYHQDWIIGKTQEQVVARFGEFRYYYKPVGYQGSLDRYDGVYQITPDRVDGLGTWQGKRLYICFDENGVAYKCYELRGGYVS